MSVNIKETNVALLMGIETTEGTAATIAATNVLRTSATSWQVGESLQARDRRSGARPLDVQQQAIRQWWEISATFPYSYSATAGTPSALAPVFLACGGSQTVVADTSVAYTRETLDLFDSATVEIRTPLADLSFDYRRRSLGARGQLGFTIATGEDIAFNVSMVGSYEDPDRVSVVTPDYGSQDTNLMGAPKAALVAVKTLDGDTICLRSITGTNYFGYTIEFDEDMCGASAKPMDSEGGSISLQMAMPDWVSGFNPYVLANRSSLNTVPLVVTVGTTEGSTLTINVEEAQVGEPSEVILPDGTRGMELSLAIVHNPQIIET